MSNAQPSESPAAQRFSGMSELYDGARPPPPDALYDLLPRLAKTARPDLVVDLGCGTGLSTRPWAAVAREVVGIDPAADMVEYARHRDPAGNVAYRAGTGNATGLADASADIVTCSSSVHWMEPESSFREITRVLRPGGVFAAYGPQVPLLPLQAWEVGAAGDAFLARTKAADQANEDEPPPPSWRWSEILKYCRTGAGFRYADELCLHNVVEWDAERYCAWLASFSYVNRRLKTGQAGTATELADFKASFEAHLGREPTPVLLSYRLIFGIR